MSIKKGIILAGGSGKRLHPLTLSISKQLLPIYDKPMIYYPLETLIRLGIKDILFIVQEDDLLIFKKTFGSGSDVGLNFSYEIQNVQRGIADAYFIADKYSNIDAVHHYEISQTSGDTSVKIDIGTDTTGYSEADLTTITNREFEEERQDTLRQIRLLDRSYIEQFVQEFETLMGESVL